MEPPKTLTQEIIGMLAPLHPGLRRRKRNGLTIFAFHEVSDSPSPFASDYGLALTRAQFIGQLDWICTHYTPVRADTMLRGEALPSDAALVTFDDGWLGSLTDGRAILQAMNIPAVYFLNLAASEGDILRSAAAAYLDRHDAGFAVLTAERMLKPPFHLSLGPGDLRAFEMRHGLSWRDGARAYQGKIATCDDLAEIDGDPLVVFGNHGYLHWNSTALNADEFANEFKQNEIRLGAYRSKRPLYAFANGVPGSAYRAPHVAAALRLGAQRVFAAGGGINPNPAAIVLDRIALTPWHHSNPRLAYAVARHNLIGTPDVSGVMRD